MRGEGNHKIPGSFAPENMEKTGAERVKYSLACQHEDAIPIKFVSYAQKCPTVLCTFAVALRKESVDRNRHHSLNLPSSPIDKNECTNLAPKPKTKATENAGPASCANNAIISVTSIFIVVISSKIADHIGLHSHAKLLRMYHIIDRVRACVSSGKS